jgi:hypothetical protein
MALAPFAMPSGPHARRHGPFGYAVHGTYKDWLRDDFQFRCVFCLEREKWDRRGWRRFRIDHIIPQSIDPTKITLYENLLYVCDCCNEFKSDWVLPDPCKIAYNEHYVFDDDGSAKALSDVGEMWIEISGLNSSFLVDYRRKWLYVLKQCTEASADLDEPDQTEELRKWFGYPDDAPDLRRSRPKGNSNAGSENSCYYVRLKNEEISPIY